MPRISATNPFVVVLVGADRLLMGTGTIRRHLFGRIPFAVGIGRCDAAVNDQVMAVAV